MTVREMKPAMTPQPGSGIRWTEVCAGEHAASARVHPTVRTGAAAGPATDRATGLAPRPVNRPLTRPGSRPGDRRTRAGFTPPVPSRAVPSRAVATRGVATRAAATRVVAPGRRVLDRPVSAEQIRACRVVPTAASPVVDDVPTWALLACGILVGLLMLLALAFLGGPAYA